MTAVGLLGRQYLGTPRDSAMLTGGMNYLMKHVPDESVFDSYYWYYGTQVLHNMSGEEWDSWIRATREILGRTQVRNVDRCANGSWDPAKDTWGLHGGRLVTTSLATLALETYYRYLLVFEAEAASPRETTGMGNSSNRGGGR